MISWVLGDQTDSPEDHSLANMNSLKIVVLQMMRGMVMIWKSGVGNWPVGVISFEDIELRRMSQTYDDGASSIVTLFRGLVSINEETLLRTTSHVIGSPRYSLIIMNNISLYIVR